MSEFLFLVFSLRYTAMVEVGPKNDLLKHDYYFLFMLGNCSLPTLVKENYPNIDRGNMIKDLTKEE